MEGTSSSSIVRELHRLHNELSERIEERLSLFRGVWERGDDRELFIELAFCILTPQSGARRCADALDCLIKTGALFKGSIEQISCMIHTVRFKNHKASYLIKARDTFLNGRMSLYRFLKECGDSESMRERLVRTVKGIGLKEASHYLRNIGRGDRLAILDRHVLRNMVRLGLIDHAPTCMTPYRYRLLEEKLRAFSDHSGIPMSHLDFLFLYRGTGDIFK